MKQYIKNNPHIWYLAYYPFYLLAFYYVEKFGSKQIHIIECFLDQKIPFIEYFIVPYFLWFVYIGVGALYFMFCEKESFIKLMHIGIFGMTVFIIISLIYPNGLELRPETFARDNIFVDLTKFLYSIDTATNVFPSIHVFNSLAMHYTIAGSEKLKHKKPVQYGSLILCILIIMATVFLKQHSVLDVMSAGALFVIANMAIPVIADQWKMANHNRKRVIKKIPS